MQQEIPELALVVLITTAPEKLELFVEKYFNKEELVEIDNLTTIEERLKIGKIIVTIVAPQIRGNEEWLIRLSKKYHVPLMGMLFYQGRTLGEKEAAYKERLEKMGFKTLDCIPIQNKEKIEVVRTKLRNDKKELHGPFDMIGDVHGCYDELCELLEKLGYKVDRQNGCVDTRDRKVVFCGDLVDRGPKAVEVLKLVMKLVEEGVGYAVLGNHDSKLLRKLKGANVQVIHGLEKTMEQLDKESAAFKEKVKYFLEGLGSHYVFDEGKLVVAHAGLKERLQGRESKKIKELAMFGETTGELDNLGLPERLDWSKHYKGKALVVYGHTPQKQAVLRQHTINVDTGCVYGGKLTAFRYPEYQIVDVQAKATYYESIRPIL